MIKDILKAMAIAILIISLVYLAYLAGKITRPDPYKGLGIFDTILLTTIIKHL